MLCVSATLVASASPSSLTGGRTVFWSASTVPASMKKAQGANDSEFDEAFVFLGPFPTDPQRQHHNEAINSGVVTL